MSSALATIQEQVQRLSPQKQAEVVRFIEDLLKDESAPPTPGLTFDWCDGPADHPAPLTSVELQHAALEWRKEGTQPGNQTTPAAVDLPGQRHKLTFDWVDDEDAEPEPLTSVELQHLATQWMVEKLEKNLARP